MRGLKPDGYEWDDKTQSSHLLQMRGLKLLRLVIMVAQLKSHLLQMRGLKQRGDLLRVQTFLSHLLQMRGLKPLESANSKEHIYVASFTDAWIETLTSEEGVKGFSRIFYRCVD